MSETITLTPPAKPVRIGFPEELLRRLVQTAASLLDRAVPPAGKAPDLPPEWFKFPPI